MTTMQPTLFDPVTRQQRNDEQRQKLDEEIALLANKIDYADKWLDANPNHPRYAEQRQKYFEAVSQHVDLSVRRENLDDPIRCVVLQLPPTVTWGQGRHSIVKVLVDAEPTSDDEMSYADLGRLIEDLKMVKGAKG